MLVIESVRVAQCAQAAHSVLVCMRQAHCGECRLMRRHVHVGRCLKCPANMTTEQVSREQVSQEQVSRDSSTSEHWAVCHIHARDN